LPRQSQIQLRLETRVHQWRFIVDDISSHFICFFSESLSSILKNRISLGSRRVRHCGHFNFLRAPEKPIPAESGVVRLTVAKVPCGVLRIVGAAKICINVATSWTFANITVYCSVRFFLDQQRLLLRDVLQILPHENESFVTRIGLPFPKSQ
jgi:hypothetical protein